MVCVLPLILLVGSPLLTDGGFENVGKGLTDWAPFGNGFEVDRSHFHSGSQSIRCANADSTTTSGAVAAIRLAQSSPAPIVVSAWSKSTGVEGPPNPDFSIYVDLVYTDGTPLWAQYAAFSTGSAGWHRKSLTIFPEKPVQSMNLYMLFRNRKGTVWFDDVEARQLNPGEVFDSQALLPPVLPKNASRQWYVRDVGAGSELVPIQRISELGLTATASSNSLTVRNALGAPRALTLYYCERFEPSGAVWYEDIRSSWAVDAGQECANLEQVPNQGATGTLSIYPFACVTNAKTGLMLGVPASSGPAVSRLFYSAPAKAMVAAFDVALVPGTKHNQTTVAVQSKKIKPAWGFRQAAAEYYAMNSRAFARRATAEGIWMPFTDPSTIPNVRDFGVAYHEGDNSVESDARLGILSFRYTEPMTWWMPMPEGMPRTYAEALALTNRHLSSGDPELRSWAQALKNSGSYDPNGNYNVEFQNQPWTNGAVWVLNPNPYLPRPNGEATKASLSYTPEMADRLYQRPLNGEYLDSIEGWADYLDYRPEAIAYGSYAPTFANDTFRPAVPIWFAARDFAAMVSADLRSRGKLLMANYTPWRLHTFMPLLDVAGTETNWHVDGVWQPDSDAIMNLRRTLSYRKPYLLLQNTDFDSFGLDKLERYLQRSMFYAIYPSMFSHNAAEKVYWENPTLYEAGRPLFKKYIPVIQRLSGAGWEPITLAKTSDPKVYVERYGGRLFTVFNDSGRASEATVAFDASLFSGKLKRATAVSAITGKALGTLDQTRRTLTLRLAPEECAVVELKPL